ncbi:GNAT family N-acetyltransferase [Rivibacter subsaxonicus]|uniref:GNAT family N-acetyltransferase n=1 Tax=Rivibacter subsaxonicus TaxID=457575 RepID=UPI00102BDB4B|nr:GNAT family N-acetyltransferase [Rivibacter subsaxonicus]
MPRIEPLDHREPALASRIHAVLMLAYAQEAKLLQVRHFAPLDRTVEDIRSSREFFLGALRDQELLGVVGIGPDDEPGQICIASLVVHPAHQRQGIARALMLEALRRGEGMVFSVSTGAQNAPALALYRELGFVDYRWGTIGAEQLALVKLRRPPTNKDC